MMTIVQDHSEARDTTIASKVMNVGIYRQTKGLVEQLRSVVRAIDIAQLDSMNLADGCNLFLNLLRDLALAPHQAAVQKRFSQAIQPCHMVAHILHLKYQGALLSIN